jgi:hypothetical protein
MEVASGAEMRRSSGEPATTMAGVRVRVGVDDVCGCAHAAVATKRKMKSRKKREPGMGSA